MRNKLEDLYYGNITPGTQQIHKNLLKKAGITENIPFHGLRHPNVRFGRKSCVKEDKRQSREREQIKG